MLCLIAGGICFLLTQCRVNYTKDRRLMQSITCASQLKQIGIALREYAREEGAYPFPDGTEGLNLLNIRSYPEWKRLFLCPSSPLRPGETDSLEESHCSYHYFSGSDPKHNDSGDILIIERRGNHENFFNVLYADGRVGGVIPETLPATLESVLRESYQNDFSTPFRQHQLETVRTLDRIFEATHGKRSK